MLMASQHERLISRRNAMIFFMQFAKDYYQNVRLNATLGILGNSIDGWNRIL